MVELLPLDRPGESRTGAERPKVADRVSLRGIDAHDAPAKPIESKPRPSELAARAAESPAAAHEAASRPSAPASMAELSQYQRRLYEVVARNSRYPAEARRQRLSGVTQLAFRIDRLGNVLDSWIQQSSGSDLLDGAALEALSRAQPLPPIPPTLPGEMQFVVEIDSSLVQQQVLGR